FGANVNTQTISVSVVGDTRFESSETFFVNLSDATNGASISDNQGQGIIANDDPQPSVINGTPGPDTLIGTAAVDTINAFGGDDTLDGLGGPDILIGGPGNDVYVVDDAGDRAVEAAGGGSDRVLAAVSFALEPSSEIEITKTTNDVGGGTINLTGNNFANILYGNAGGNTLDGGGGIDLMV